jgi:hypothetical protein
MSDPRDRLSPAQPESASGPRGSQQSRAPQTRCARQDEVRSCLGVCERGWDGLCQLLSRWHPTSREGPRPSLASCLILPRARWRPVMWSHAASRARRTRTAIRSTDQPSSMSPGRADGPTGMGLWQRRPGPPQGHAVHDLGRSSPRVARRLEGTRPTRTGEGRWTALASTDSDDSTFRRCGGVRQGGKSDQHKVPDPWAAAPSRWTCLWTTRTGLPSGRPSTRLVCGLSTSAARRALQAPATSGALRSSVAPPRTSGGPWVPGERVRVHGTTWRCRGRVSQRAGVHVPAPGSVIFPATC